MVMPKVDRAIGDLFRDTIRAADEELRGALAATGNFDARMLARRAHKDAYEAAAAVFDASWLTAWDAACEAAWGPVVTGFEALGGTALPVVTELPRPLRRRHPRRASHPTW